MELIECISTSLFHKKIIELSNIGKSPLYLLFLGAKAPATGKSWCPDCVRAEPILISSFQKYSSKVILVNLERNDYKSSQNFYRMDQKIKLKCVPTLIKLENGIETGRLNDSQCQNLEIVENFIKEN